MWQILFPVVGLRLLLRGGVESVKDIGPAISIQMENGMTLVFEPMSAFVIIPPAGVEDGQPPRPMLRTVDFML